MTTLRDLGSKVEQLGYNDFLKNLPEARALNEDGKSVRIAVLRSYTIEAIEPALEFLLHLEGYRSEYMFGAYNQFVQEVLDPGSSMYAFGPDIVVLCLRVEDLMPDFCNSFGSVDMDWAGVIAAKANEIGDLAESLRRNSSAQVVVQSLTAPVSPYLGIFDAQMPAGQAACIARFNQILAERLGAVTGAYVWDYDRFVREVGQQQIFDPKMYYLAKNPFRQRILPALAADLTRHLLSILGKSRKCVVLDLDNTLWGGVIGEDGIENIRLGHTYPGLCYREFQQNLLKLYHRGVILAINSKNNEADALRVMDEHPDMVLRREHFAAMEINWTDKPTNMRSLSKTLNIGLESMVMIDDNPAECEFIRGAVPECGVICLPDKPYLIPAVAERIPGLENIRLTSEDRKKGAMYQAQARRREHEQSYSSIDEFLASLDLEVSIEIADQFSIPRVAQLTQKTNQFNVTTRRYTEADISALVERPDTDVFSVSVRDRFGDNGIVGVMIAKFADGECIIDSLLLSCRVIGRNIEIAMLARLAAEARARGSRSVVGEFVPTSKNAPAADLFVRAGFEGGDGSGFRLDLSGSEPQVPSYIRVAGTARET